jgi:hypothetical protein
MLSETDEIKQYIQGLSAAIEEKTKAEASRIAAEQMRANAERERVAINEKNEKLLTQTISLLQELVIVVNQIEPQMDAQTAKIEMIFEMMRIIVSWLYGQGYREAQHLDEIIKQVARRGDMKVDIHSARDTNTGDIVDGTNIKGNDLVYVISQAKQAIESGDIETAESVLNTLPMDAIDVAVAALQSPLQAAVVVAKKIGEKIKLLRGGEDC